MKMFTFDLYPQGEAAIDNNGYVFKSKVRKLGTFSLTTPIQKEVTYTKGPVARYIKHTVWGIGYARSDSWFRGIAFFDLHIRVPVVVCILLGVGYASGSFYSGILWAIIFYLLISFLYSSDDESLIHKLKAFFQKTI